MEPDEVARADSAGCMMACGLSWTLAGSVKIEAGGMVVMGATVCLAHGIYVTAEIASPDRSNLSRRLGGGAKPQRVFGSGRTIKSAKSVDGQMSRTSGKRGNWGSNGLHT